MSTGNFHMREGTKQSRCLDLVRDKAPQQWIALPQLLVLLAVVWHPGVVQAWTIATPSSISICDDAHYRGSAMYNKYCGGAPRQSYVPQGPSPEELRRRQEEQRQELQRQREAERKRNADAADEKGLEAARRGDWREAANQFIEALRFAPESPEIKAHLEQATTALADASSAAEILVLHQRVEDAIAAANLNAFREGVEDDLAAQRLVLMSESFRGQTVATPVHEPVSVPVPAGGRKRLYPALKSPVAPGTPPATVLARAQPKIRDVDKEIRRAQLALRRLITSNAHSEEERVEWVKVSEEATVEAQNLSVSLVIDLVGAHVDHLSKVRDEQGVDVLNRLLNRTPEDGQRKGLHVAFGMLLNRKEELERIGSEIRLAGKSNDLRQKISTFDMNRDSKYSWENLWDVVSQFKKVEELSGPSKDLLDAAYTIYKQAASFENLSAIRANQEKTLQAAATLHKYIVRLEEQKRATRH